MWLDFFVWVVGWMGVGFLGLELPAHYRLVPWTTLSAFFWEAEQEWTPTTWFVVAFLFVLGLHIVKHLSVEALITVVACAFVTLGVHFLFGTP